LVARFWTRKALDLTKKCFNYRQRTQESKFRRNLPGTCTWFMEI